MRVPPQKQSTIRWFKFVDTNTLSCLAWADLAKVIGYLEVPKPLFSFRSIHYAGSPGEKLDAAWHDLLWMCNFNLFSCSLILCTKIWLTPASPTTGNDIWVKLEDLQAIGMQSLGLRQRGATDYILAPSKSSNVLLIGVPWIQLSNSEKDH